MTTRIPVDRNRALRMAGTLLGLAVAWSIFPLMQGFIGVATMPPIVPAYGVALAMVLALAIGLPPAWRLQRLRLVDALAGR